MKIWEEYISYKLNGCAILKPIDVLKKLQVLLFGPAVVFEVGRHLFYVRVCATAWNTYCACLGALIWASEVGEIEGLI